MPGTNLSRALNLHHSGSDLQAASYQRVFKGSSKGLQVVFKLSSRGLQEVFKHYKSKEFRVIQSEPKILRLVFKTFLKRYTPAKSTAALPKKPAVDTAEVLTHIYEVPSVKKLTFTLKNQNHF